MNVSLNKEGAMQGKVELWAMQEKPDGSYRIKLLGDVAGMADMLKLMQVAVEAGFAVSELVPRVVEMVSVGPKEVYAI